MKKTQLKKQGSEKEIQKAILDWLTANGIFHYRQNSGAIKTEYKGRKGFYKFASIPGLPDIVAIIDGVYVGIEVKSQSKQSDAQKEFQEQLEKAKGKYILAKSIEDIEIAIKKLK